jgi:hypothetical protein
VTVGPHTEVTGRNASPGRFADPDDNHLQLMRPM